MNNDLKMYGDRRVFYTFYNKLVLSMNLKYLYNEIISIRIYM